MTRRWRRPTRRRPATTEVTASPQRTCIGCRRLASQRELVRIVRSPDGAMRRAGRHESGRGAWLCAATVTDCAELARKKKAFARAFRAPVSSAASNDIVACFGLVGRDMADLTAADGSAVVGNQRKG